MPENARTTLITLSTVAVVTALLARRTKRGQLAASAVLGRPIASRLKIVDGAMTFDSGMHHARVYDCHFDGTERRRRAERLTGLISDLEELRDEIDASVGLRVEAADDTRVTGGVSRG